MHLMLTRSASSDLLAHFIQGLEGGNLNEDLSPHGWHPGPRCIHREPSLLLKGNQVPDTFAGGSMLRFVSCLTAGRSFSTLSSWNSRILLVESWHSTNEGPVVEFA